MTKTSLRLACALASTVSLLTSRGAAQDAPPTPTAPQSVPAFQQTSAPPAAPASEKEEDQKAPSQEAPLPADRVPAPRPSKSFAVNLLNRLVERGVLTKEDAAQLIQQAQQDAELAKQDAYSAAQKAAAAQVALLPPPGQDLPPVTDDTVRVTYIPETVKAELRDQIKLQVMQQAKDENWAQPRALPDWVKKFRFFGEFRLRYEHDFFAAGNDNTGAFPNFNSINQGGPFDVAGTVFPPELNVDEDRQQFRLQARFGFEALLDSGFSTGFRIVSGSSSSPVSQNQSFGAATGGVGGNFSKYAIWLDRAFLRWDIGSGDRTLGVVVGRFDNPFFSTNLLWDDDIGFDGIAFQARYKVAESFTPFVAGGLFPVFNTDFNFSSNRPSKFASDDKYLYAIQAGFELKPANDWKFKFAATYYYFEGVEGKLSDPYIPLNSSDQGNTDSTRPSFAQKGNTYFPLRNIIAAPENNFGATNQFQYFGLITPYEVFALTARLEYTKFDPIRVSLIAEYINNLAYDFDELNQRAVNNRGADNPTTGALGDFAGGEDGYYITLMFGKEKLTAQGEWNAGVNYRYVQSDAFVDAFVDSDFGLGGTNLEGYTIFASYALSKDVWLRARWMSSSEVAGPPQSVDIFQLDLNGRF